MNVVVGYIVGCACYGLATTFPIRFSDRLYVASAAAFAPAVAWSAFAQSHLALLALPPLFAALALTLRRHPLRESASHAALFGLVVTLTGAARVAGIDQVLLPSLVGGAAYLGVDYLRQRRAASPAPLIGSDMRTWWLLQGVLLCACGLTGLGVEQMDWPAFAAMAGVLVLTKSEFEAFAQSREAYQQTVRAVEGLQNRGSAIYDPRSGRQP